MADKKIITGLVAVILTSLCCVVPVLAVLAGVSSIASSFKWMEPYHNYLVVITIAILLFAWWEKLKPQTMDPSCACDENNSFWSSKRFLGLVTIFAAVMLTFPMWGAKYISGEEACTTCVSTPQKVVEKKVESKTTSKKEQADKAELKAALVAKYIEEEKKSPIRKGAGACAGIGYEAADNLLSRARDEIKSMSPFVLKKLIDNEDDFILLDVREAEQRSEGEIYVSESYAMTRGNLEFRIMNLLKDKDAIIVVYCRSGGRSAFAAQTLQKLGYKNVYDLQGGLKNWVAFGYPFENGLGVVVKVEQE